MTEISDASRIDAELSRATFERVDLLALTRAIVGSREDRDQNAGHPIRIACSLNAVPVMGEPSRLERVIVNLLDNAVSFSPPEAEVIVDIARVGGLVTLSVIDAGPGIAEDRREQVFHRFHSLRPESEDFGNHSGLGLAIARSIAEAHDGTLVASARGDGLSGAVLTLTLPAARGAR